MRRPAGSHRRSAERALTHFESQPEVDEGHYRWHDDDEALIVAHIAENHASLRVRAMIHLVALLARAQHARSSVAEHAVEAHIDIAAGSLAALAASNTWARDVLAMTDKTPPDPAAIDDATTRLTEAVAHVAGHYTVGTSAVRDSILARGLPARKALRAVSVLLDNASSPAASTHDRGDYLLAAANLADRVPQQSRRRLYHRALAYMSSPTPSELDILEQGFSHPLGATHFEHADETYDRALLLAARLASTDDERARVKALCFSLLGDAADSHFTLTGVLESLGDVGDEDIAFLATRGWPLRAFAARRWSLTRRPPHLGPLLARDRDVRVRRALATGLAGSEIPVPDSLLGALRSDPAFSARSSIVPG